MKKLMVALFVLAVAAFASAQSFSVGATYTDDFVATVEYGHDVSVGELLFGVAVVPMSWETEVSVGVRAPLFEITGGEDLAVVALSGRLHVPVFNGTDLAVGQVDASVVLDFMLPQEQSGVTLIFSGGVRAPVTAEGLTNIPQLVVGASLQF